MLKDRKMNQVMWKTSLRMDAYFNIESVYSSSPKYIQRAEMYQAWESINKGDFISSAAIPLRKLVISVSINVDSIFI